MDNAQILKDFGTTLQHLRKQKVREDGRPWTQKDLAYEAGVMEPNHISKLERGEAEPGLTTLIALAVALDCTLDDLVNIRALKAARRS